MSGIDLHEYFLRIFLLIRMHILNHIVFEFQNLILDYDDEDKIQAYILQVSNLFLYFPL